ncbi:DUF2218 domain-containing protein [Henriciella aquimarina]|uniref:DUF2218 domain-containing protein n=1 Tax=Henriciella aquimarina TaxID=545261 RepID=UPI000A0045EF|nr:DUF2218 domain-containing protein [Henriciella aquimarina]
MTRQAIVATAHASRYLQQLCKHWSHKFDVDYSPNAGRIALPLGDVALKAGETDLTIQITPTSVDNLEKLEDVVASHIDRFAHKEGGLTYDWQPA